MKNKIILFTSFLFLLIIFLMPAKIINKFLPAKSGVVISGIDGTVWSGKIGNLQLQGWSLEDIDFNTRVFSLITGKLGADVNIFKGDLIGNLAFELQDSKTVNLENANIKTSLSHFEKYIPFKGIELKGNLETRQVDLHILASRLTYLYGKTLWNDGAVTFNGKLWTLGNFELDWKTNEDGSIQAKILKGENILDIQGDINISKQGLLDFSGSISTGVDKSIFNAFLFFADGKQSNGRQALKFKKKIW